MKKYCTLHLLLLTLFLHGYQEPSLYAQSRSGDDELYIPPTLSVKVWGLGTEETSQKASSQIVIPAVIYSRYTPFLPIIFFDQGESGIADRYQLFGNGARVREYREYDPVYYPNDADEWKTPPKYYEILNIIGSRMTSYPATSIRLEGGYSTEPGEDQELGDERTRTVRDYLVNHWEIDTSRITLLPARQMTDSNDHIFLQEEGRRVTIGSDDWELMRPMGYNSIESYKWSTLFAFKITIDPKVSAEQVAEIELFVALDDRRLNVLQIAGSPDSSLYRLIGLWTPFSQVCKGKEHLSMQAVVTTHDGRKYSSAAITLPIVDGGTDHPWEPRPGFDTAYTQNIFFFESGSTSLSPLQEEMVRRYAIYLKRQLAKGFPFPVVVPCVGSGEAGESPEVDRVTMITDKIAYEGSNSFDLQEMTPPFIAPISLLSYEAFQKTGMNVDGLRTWYKTTALTRENGLSEADELYIKGWHSYSSPLPSEPLSDVAIAKLDTLYRLRAASVGKLLARYIDSTQLDSIQTRSELDKGFYNGGWRPALQVIYTPEGRFYKRHVKIPYNELRNLNSSRSDPIIEGLEGTE